MRKIVLKIVLLIVLAALCQGTFLFAQSTRYEESNYYFFNFSVEKIFLHRLGYVVTYRTGGNRIASTYIPHSWFNTIGGQGEIVYLGTGSEWPSMIVYYKDGEFSHVRLRLRKNRQHETWGVVPLTAAIDENFDVEEVILQF